MYFSGVCHATGDGIPFTCVRKHNVPPGKWLYRLKQSSRYDTSITFDGTASPLTPMDGTTCSSRTGSNPQRNKAPLFWFFFHPANENHLSHFHIYSLHRGNSRCLHSLKFRDTGKRVNEDKTPVCLSCVVHPVGWAGKHLHIPLPLTKRYIQ